MAKLHEVLAVEGDLEGTYKKILEEAMTTFAKKDEHFNGHYRQTRMFSDEAPEQPEEHKELVTTVHAKLEYISGHVIRYFDAVAQKERTNQVARADLEVDGSILVKEMPATLLLGLETKLKHIRQVYETIPTLVPGLEWVPDSQKGDHIYRAKHLEKKHKTQKTVQHKILVPATKEHPAQIEKWTEDLPVGMIEIQKWSGMLSPAEKSQFLGRIDKLLRAVKKARQRANTADVVELDIGKTIFDYIYAG